MPPRAPAGNDLAETTCKGVRGIDVTWTSEAGSTSLSFGKRGSADGRASDANARARKLADDMARTFRFGQDKRVDR